MILNLHNDMSYYFGEYKLLTGFHRDENCASVYHSRQCYDYMLLLYCRQNLEKEPIPIHTRLVKQ